MAHKHPISGDGLTADYLTGLMREVIPGASVETVKVVEAKTYGEQFVSTAGRAIVEVTYGKGSPPNLTTHLVVKLARGIDKILEPFYANEVNFYRRIRPELKLEAPRMFGGDFDAESGNFGLVLEDLTARKARFPNATKTLTSTEVRGILKTLAALHARFWESPRFATDLSWVGTPLAGGVSRVLYDASPAYIQHEIDQENFKRELVAKIHSTGDELLAGTLAVQRHFAHLPQTLLHGDTHLGNTYLLPDGTGGLLDWQLMVRGHHMHDVNYLITTALSVEDRRTHERELLEYYLHRLEQGQVPFPPKFDDAWLEYRRTLVWGIYIGWLTTPVVNYGWEINLLNHLRLVTAYEDHETAKLVKELL